MSEQGRAPASPRRKVAFFLPDMGGGGAERVQLAIIRHLVGLGHEVHLILASGGGVLLPLVPPEVRVVELHAARLAATLPRLVRYLRAERPYSLQAIMWPCTVIAVAARMLARVPTKLLLTDHVALNQQYAEPRRRMAVSATLRLFYPRAEHVAAVSRGAAEQNERLAGLPSGSIEVIYNPMDLPETLPTADRMASTWTGSGPRLIAIGNLKEQKNHDLLLRAFRRLLESNPTAELLILGEGPLRPRLEQRCRELGIADRVRLPGFAVDPWPYLVSADLFVLSSDYEGMGLVIVEALHAGLRVVSTDCIAGPAELLDDGRYGRLTPVGDEEALARAMAEELAKPKNPERQRARVRQITGPHNLRRYADILTRPDEAIHA